MCMSDLSGGVTYDRCTRRDITYDHCAAADDGVSADRDARKDGGANADECAWAYGDGARQVNTRGNVDVIADACVVIDGAACVQNDVLTDCRTCVYDDARTHHGADAHNRVRRDHRTGVADSREPIATRLKSRSHCRPRPVVANRNDDRVMVDHEQRIDAAEDRHPEELTTMCSGVVIGEGQQVVWAARALTCHDDVPDYLAVATGTDDDEVHARGVPRNSLAVAWPGCVMPSRVISLPTVNKRIFKSSQNDW